MGVPKFFRYISERYPCLSEVVKEYQIPQFDNLYLDMNGIIHMCSHPDDENVHFRITEEKIFNDIFHYIEVLFRMIKPQKLFFMAVDGVAPRAKMNQQRGRRFRSAKEADKREAAAAKKGEVLPQEARFDSNCITPGTVFMAKLHEQLKYFVVDKISNDPMWQKCKIILSGHETPGEGEHKIMDYIRYMRSRPGYDPNTRHCLYGLDADLIMLGLCTHEPHFCLLREEVKFGRKSTKRISVPEEIKFYLLHLSLLRDYLELEFSLLKDTLRGYDFDIEKIIDDWVLMGFLVGNDFIPHLPNMHIVNGALPILYKTYMEILPSLDGYINESGTLNLERFARFMEKLSNIDLKNFEEIKDDLLYMEAKTGRKQNAHFKVSTKQKPVDSGLAALIQEAEDICLSSDDDQYDENEENQSEDEEAFRTYKNQYYQNKLEYENVTPEVMRQQAEGYVRAIQWNLNYYYHGCCSWSWYYPHHYAPYISDVKGFTNLDITFDSEKPFLPFEQLLAVLPPASKELLPQCYHELMLNENSPIKKYYPEDFETDLNGKRQEWEAVVLVPFIDEKLLLEAMSYCNDKLTTEEKLRNSHGPMLIYSYTPKDMGFYEAPNYFSPVIHSHAELKEMSYSDIFVPEEKLIKGAYPGAKMNVYYPGFPTMKHLKYMGELRKARIKVFETPSQNENMIVSIIPEKNVNEMIPVDLLGTNIFVNWPHLIEAKVVAISNCKRKYISMGGPNQYDTEEKKDHIKQFQSENEGITQFYQKRMGIEVGETKVLIHVKTLTGRKYVFTSNGDPIFEKQFCSEVSNYPLQAVVYNISAYDEFGNGYNDIEHIFPINSICFTLTNPYYGSQGVIQENLFKKTGRIKICVSVSEEPDFTTVRALQWKTKCNYRNLHSVASQLSISNGLFSRITGSIFIVVPTNEGSLKNTNIGLDLKLNKRNKETPGYTKKVGNTWFYADKVIDLVQCYAEKFPDVFEYLTRDYTFDDIDVEKLFGNEWEERLKELQIWLRSLPYHNLERRACGSDDLESEVIEEIERTVDNFTSGNVKLVTMRIKPNFLYTPDIQTGTLIPDSKMDVRVLDRIVNVRQGFTVPFGLKGTIIAIQKSTSDSDMDTLYDIVFDKPFKNGMRLNCSEGRGYRLPKTAFINISYGQRLLQEKTGKPDDVIANAEASHSQDTNSFQDFSNNFKSPQSKEWFNVQQRQDPYNNSQYFNPQNSAFAQFDYRKPYNHYEPQVTNQIPYDSYNNRESYEGYNRQHRYGAEFRQDSGSRNYSNDRPKYRSENRDTTQQKYEYNRQQNRQLERQEQYKTEYNKENVKLKYSNHQPNENKTTEVKPDLIRTPRFPVKPVEIEKKDFMPRFNNNIEISNSKKGQGVQETHQVKTDNLCKPSNSELENSPQRKLTVNTQFLQTLLGLKDKKSTNSNSDISNTNKINLAENIVSKNEPVNVSFDMLLPIASAPASVKLLTYYQSNGLGLPRYQYFNCGNMTQAQIRLADGMAVIGKTANSREEATENVAAEVLELLMNKNKSTMSKTEKSGNDIPTSPKTSPPKAWVQHENKENPGSLPKSEESGGSKTKSDTSAVLNKSFVPLQAVKSHIKHSASASSSKQTDELKDGNLMVETQEVTKENTASGKSSNTTKEDVKPKTVRKTRIAANFLRKD